jgi:CheY-like chemotaxis protein
MLDQGLNPQFLAMEGARILDENRYATKTGGLNVAFSDNVDEFEFDLVDTSNIMASSLKAERHPLVIVDDDGPTLRKIVDVLTAKGFVVHAMTRSEDTLIKVDSLHKGGEHPIVLIDLIMPKMDGSGVLGGIELLDLLHNNFKDLKILIMSDYHHSDAEKRISDHGYPFIVKPRRCEINTPTILHSFITKITDNIQNPTANVASDRWQNRFNLGDELRIEMGDVENNQSGSESSQQDDDLSLLYGMLDELKNPELQDGVLLVLRFASEFLNRSIVFTVKDRIISGFGQFGITGGSTGGNERVCAIHIPLESVSLFAEPFRTGLPTTFTPVSASVGTFLYEQLGGGIPAEAFIGPLKGQSGVIGFLYGDNLPYNKTVGDVAPLIAFLSQAGFLIEEALLKSSWLPAGNELES